MGLQLAVKAHSDGNLPLAEAHYKRALEQKVNKPILYQNYGACLRSLEKLDEALQIYEIGLQKFPNNIDILTNYANAVKVKSSTKAISAYLIVFRYHLGKDIASEKTSISFLNLSSSLFECGFFAWNLKLIKSFAPYIGYSPGIIHNLLLLLDEVNDRYGWSSSELATQNLMSILHDSMSSLSDVELIDLRFSLFQHYSNVGKVDQAHDQFSQANKLAINVLSKNHNLDYEERAKIQKKIDVNYWNGACTLLKLQDFSNGWKMYDYGLRAPCAGPQRWQRALAKPFSSSQVPIWRGEILAGRSLLLLEEQGIGDAMMFLTLIPTLIDEGAKISLFLSDRLVPIYKQALAKDIHQGCVNIVSRNDYYEGKCLPHDFDFQSALGSICRFRYHHPDNFAPRVPFLLPDFKLVNRLREKYINDSGRPVKKLVGISWRGGGRSARIIQKSVNQKDFSSLLSDVPGVRFVSLQYGESLPVVTKWRDLGIDVIHDENIDAMKDMKNWLSQVAACDAVLSIANTTIHGAGGLNKPTLCLLSRHSDWRWLNDPSIKRSYWYPSVGISREDQQLGWAPALASAKDWLLAGCPMPSGASSL